MIYHEYTHNVLQEIFDDFIGWPDAFTEGYAMDEGFADYFACALTDDPLCAENVSSSPRSLENMDWYTDPATYGLEGHTGGSIISGACWDLRKSVVSRSSGRQGETGEDTVDRLVFRALNILAAWPGDYYFSSPSASNLLDALRIAADGNHETEINQAFRKHNLLPVDLWIADNTDDFGTA